MVKYINFSHYSRKWQALLMFGGLSWAMAWGTAVSFAKGLDQISKQNPTAQPPPKPVAESGVPPPSSALSQTMVGQIFMATSAGFVTVSKSSGEWKSGGGTTDIVVGYKVYSGIPDIPVFGTYRYSPVAVSGSEKGREYRGVWETHYFGAQGHMTLNPDLTAYGGAELGYTLIYLQPLDGSIQAEKAEENGVALALGGGLDYKMLENRLSVGPRLHLGFGSTSVYQLSASAGFYF